MVNYKNSKIYIIKSNKTDKVYVGSTTLKLKNRLSNHRCEYKKGNRYLSSFEIIKYDDNYIELIKEFPCNNRDELEKEEGYYIKTLNSVNKNICGRNKLEKKIMLRNSWKKYYKKNKKKVLNYKKQKIYCECGSEISRRHIATHRKSNRHNYFNSLFDNFNNNIIF